jgi:prefoldin subunit 5
MSEPTNVIQRINKRLDELEAQVAKLQQDVAQLEQSKPSAPGKNENLL